MAIPVSTKSLPISLSIASIIWLLNTYQSADVWVQLNPFVSTEGLLSSDAGGCCKGVCTVAKLTVAIQGVFLGRDCIQFIAASTGPAPRKVRARLSVKATCSTLPSELLMTKGDT